MKKLSFLYLAIPVIALAILMFTVYPSRDGGTSPGPGMQLAAELEESLFTRIVDVWYPRCIDSVYGGFIPDFEYDWTLSEGPQNKAIVHQARHLWTLSFLHEKYPGKDHYLEYARQGFRFIRDHMQDDAFGGFWYEVTRDGKNLPEMTSFKRVYGQAFAINGLAQYYKASHDEEALDLAIKTFLWMNDHARDKKYGGYFEILKRDGTPGIPDDGVGAGDLAVNGLKEFNSSLHILEAFTELYRVWPDALLRQRLQEVYLEFRDVFIQPAGYLRLYFYPDWKAVPPDMMESLSGGNYWFTQHITYGHDVETAYLLLEAGKALGLDKDEKARMLARKLVDHSLASGWDNDRGGFYYVGYENGGKTRIHVPYKAWWTEAEGLNALMLMSRLYPGDTVYPRKFRELWQYTDSFLIDKKYGGWYNYGTDNYPANATQKKSHNWKATYHNVRSMVNCIEMLRTGPEV